MPSVGRPVTSFAEFIADIQTVFYGLIADLTARVDVLEKKAPAPSGSATVAYASTGSIVNNANLTQAELLSTVPMFGSTTIPGGTLTVGSTIIISAIGYNSTGGAPETLTFTLWGSPEPPIITCNTHLDSSFGGAIGITIVMAVRDTDMAVNMSITNGVSISSAYNVLMFDKSIDCPLTLTNSWLDSEAGGMLIIESRTIEIKHPPA